MKRMLWRTPTLVGVAFLTACASLPRDRGAADVAALVRASGGVDPEHAAAAATPENDQPWGDDALIAHALSHHPAFRQLRAELGLAAMDRFDAGRWANPAVAYGERRVDEDGAFRIRTFSVSLPLAEWLLTPVRSRIGEARWQAAIHRVAWAIDARILDVRSARIACARAERADRIDRAAADAADTARALARTLYEAGNIDFKTLLAERAAAADAALAALASRAERDAARAALAEAIGWSDVATLPKVSLDLPLPGPADADRDRWIERGLAEHPEVVAARQSLIAAQRAATVAKRAWWLLDLEVERERERGADGVREQGPRWSLRLPLFRQGQDTRLTATAWLEQAEAERDARTLAVRQAVDVALSQRRNARERAALLRDDALPAHEALVREQQRHYNAMLGGAFELIAARREQYRAYRDYLDAVADHALAGIALARAVGTPLEPAAAAALLPEPELPDFGDAP